MRCRGQSQGRPALAVVSMQGSGPRGYRDRAEPTSLSLPASTCHEAEKQHDLRPVQRWDVRNHVSLGRGGSWKHRLFFFFLNFQNNDSQLAQSSWV